MKPKARESKAWKGDSHNDFRQDFASPLRKNLFLGQDETEKNDDDRLGDGNPKIGVTHRFSDIGAYIHRLIQEW